MFVHVFMLACVTAVTVANDDDDEGEEEEEEKKLGVGA